jgi:hypothetical protein
MRQAQQCWKCAGMEDPATVMGLGESAPSLRSAELKSRAGGSMLPAETSRSHGWAEMDIERFFAVRLHSLRGVGSVASLSSASQASTVSGVSSMGPEGRWKSIAGPRYPISAGVKCGERR